MGLAVRNITGYVDDLLSESWTLTPEAVAQLQEIKAKGVENMTPVEATWMAVMIGERHEKALRDRVIGLFS